MKSKSMSHANSPARVSYLLPVLLGPTLAIAQCTTPWLPGDGQPGLNGAVAAIKLWDPDGSGSAPPLLVVGGSFTRAGTVPVNGIACYDPASGNWSAFGGSGMNGVVGRLAILANGDLVASGAFTMAGGVAANNIARWNGSSWAPLGSGIPTGGAALAALPNGDLVAGGTFTTAGGVAANYVARWNGTTWSPLGSGANAFISALTTLPNGDLVVGGDFTTIGGVGAARVARWNGASWSSLGAGMNGYVAALAMTHNGELAAGGDFVTAGGNISTFFARLTTTCPAGAIAFGAGCTGSGGLNELTATSLPWTGSTFTSLATGMPSNALALGVRGLSTMSVPLSSILPQGVAGCTLLVTPDLLDLLLPAAGSVQTQFAIPNTVVLAGQIVHQQIVPVELGALGDITALTSTNRLTLTIGMF